MIDVTTHDPRLLAIDDSVLIHRLLKVRLRNEKIEIHHAMTGETGLAMAASLQPEVLLLDVELEDIHGFEVLRKLKSQHRTHDIPVILLSGTVTTKEKVQGLDLGAVDFITKPFDVSELKARVRSALRMQSLIRMLAQRAQLDGMTGLWNRSFFDQRLKEELFAAVRHDRPLSLIMSDIDQFKTINDNHGHPFGDHVIERFAHLLSNNRSGDIACRYGGEEFALLLPSTNLQQAARVAHRLCRNFEKIPWADNVNLTVTASFGVSGVSHPRSSTSAQVLLQAADQALYEAKRAGRNCVRTTDINQANLRLTG